MSSVQHSATSAYLRLGNEYCLLCNAFITTSEQKKCCTFKPSGWVTLQNKAKEWALLCIPEEDKRHYFCKVHQKIHTSTESFGIAHNGCRSYFLGKINKYERDFPKKDALEHADQQSTSSQVPQQDSPRKMRSQHKVVKRICFACDEIRECEQQKKPASYDNGGLGRCG